MSRVGKTRQVVWLDPDLMLKALELAKQLNVPVNVACIELMKRGVQGGGEVKKYACQECGMEFTDKEALIRHVKEQHPPMLLCPFCLRPSIDLNTLRKHVIEEAKAWNLPK